MDEPCSALDPIATRKIEELMLELEEAVHHRHRHAQPAAGPARGRQDRLPLRRHHAGRPHRLPGRVRRLAADLRESRRKAHAGVHPRRIQLRGCFTSGRAPQASCLRSRCSSSFRSSITPGGANHALAKNSACLHHRRDPLRVGLLYAPRRRAARGTKPPAGWFARAGATFPAPLYQHWFDV